MSQVWTLADLHILVALGFQNKIERGCLVGPPSKATILSHPTLQLDKRQFLPSHNSTE